MTMTDQDLINRTAKVDTTNSYDRATIEMVCARLKELARPLHADRITEALTAAKPVTVTDALRALTTKIDHEIARMDKCEVRDSKKLSRIADIVNAIDEANFNAKAALALSQEHVAGESEAVTIKPMETAPFQNDDYDEVSEDIFVHKGAWAIVHGTNGKAAGWIDTHEMFAHQLYRDQILPTPELQESAQFEVVDNEGVRDLIEELLDAQQDINLAANERMDQSLCDASALIDKTEAFLRRITEALEEARGEVGRLQEWHNVALRAGERQSRYIDQLEAALKPFAFLADCYEEEKTGASVIVNIERCRDARAALHSNQKGAGDEA